MYNYNSISSTDIRAPLPDHKKRTLYSTMWIPLSVVLPSVSIFSSRAVVCILLTILFESILFWGVSGNLLLFATDTKQLNLVPTVATTVVYSFTGIVCFFSVPAGWLGDSSVGKYCVTLVGLPVSIVGASLILLGSISEADKYVSWAAVSLTTDIHFKTAVYMSGLVLVAFGHGAIAATLPAFGADQASLCGGPEEVESFFLCSFWFWAFGALIVYTFVVYIQQEISYFYGYIVPVISAILALAIFLAGKRSYHIWRTIDNNFLITFKIVCEALKTSRRNDFSVVPPQHWLDRAKPRFGGSFRRWQVEEVKTVYRLLPVFCSMILYFTIYKQMTTAMLYQGQYMDTIVTSSFPIPISSLTVFNFISVLVLIPVMNRLVYPLLARCNIRVSHFQRIGIGMIIAALSMAYSGVLERYRKEKCCQTHDRGTNNTETMVSNITIFYQAPQYFLMGASEVFTVVTAYEVTCVEAPRCMQAVLISILYLCTGLGSYVGAALVAIVNAVTGPRNSKWYPDKADINDGELANYFFLLAILMLFNFLLYIFAAHNFRSKKKAAVLDDDDDETSTTTLLERNKEMNKSHREIWSIRS